ncbi:hypothetical protein SAMN06265218_11573 [Fodinibius sediminis]|uniref:Uncharacterized protein n=1 Tax=Fodinibius sediminis TaxID=1214077 RepID=A0A521EDU0_9BACT|nr:hypothetical protein SAMN06265218_11573 [Fodinibius sediminis]
MLQQLNLLCRENALLDMIVTIDNAVQILNEFIKSVRPVLFLGHIEKLPSHHILSLFLYLHNKGIINNSLEANFLKSFRR